MNLVIYDDQINNMRSEYHEGMKILEFKDIINNEDGMLAMNIDKSFDIVIKKYRTRKEKIDAKLTASFKYFEYNDITNFEANDIFIANERVVKIPKQNMSYIDWEKTGGLVYSYYKIPLFGRYSKQVLDKIEQKIRAKYGNEYMIICDFENIRTNLYTTWSLEDGQSSEVIIDKVQLEMYVKGRIIECVLTV